MPNTLVDLVKCYATSTGTGPFVLGSAVLSFRGAEALIDGKSYSYSVQQGANYEVGSGTYSASGQTLTRSVEFSSNGNSPISLAPNAIVNFPALAADFAVEGPAGPAGPAGPPGPGVDTTAFMVKAANLSDVADVPTARNNLGLTRILEIAIVGTALTASEVLGARNPPAGEVWHFPANFAGAVGIAMSGSVNPAANEVISLVDEAGASLGTITISAAGAVTFATAGGLAFTRDGSAGEGIAVVGPATADTAKNFSIAIPFTITG